MITDRRICWPGPDRVCLEGGCIYCNGYPFMPIERIETYARAGDRLLWLAFLDGRAEDFNLAEIRVDHSI